MFLGPTEVGENFKPTGGSEAWDGCFRFTALSKQLDA